MGQNIELRMNQKLGSGLLFLGHTSKELYDGSNIDPLLYNCKYHRPTTVFIAYFLDPLPSVCNPPPEIWRWVWTIVPNFGSRHINN